MCNSWDIRPETQNGGVWVFSHLLLHSFPHSFIHPGIGALSLMGRLCGGSHGVATGSQGGVLACRELSSCVAVFRRWGMTQTPRRNSLLWRSRHGRKPSLSISSSAGFLQSRTCATIPATRPRCSSCLVKRKLRVCKTVISHSPLPKALLFIGEQS